LKHSLVSARHGSDVVVGSLVVVEGLAVVTGVDGMVEDSGEDVVDGTM